MVGPRKGVNGITYRHRHQDYVETPICCERAHPDWALPNKPDCGASCSRARLSRYLARSVVSQMIYIVLAYLLARERRPRGNIAALRLCKNILTPISGINAPFLFFFSFFGYSCLCIEPRQDLPSRPPFVYVSFDPAGTELLSSLGCCSDRLDAKVPRVALMLL
jgi:hypothetical protein